VLRNVAHEAATLVSDTENLSAKERTMLRALAQEVAEIATLPIHKEAA
jgi:hypothetical protein